MTDLAAEVPLEDLRRVDAADVYKGERLAARLWRHGAEVHFSYQPDYLTDTAAPPVAWTLPKTSDVLRTAGGAVPPFFAGLLPEGIRLRAVVAGTRTSEDDHLTLLIAVGADAIGDVRVVPAGDRPGHPATTVVEDRIPTLDLADVFSRAVTPDPVDFERIALPGVQAKVSAAMVSAPINTTAGPAILKLNPDRGYPRLVENEHFFLTMAADCGLVVPEHRLVVDRTGSTGLLVARFDRTPEQGGGFSRLAQEDACQLLSAYPAAKYRLNTETVARTLADVVETGLGAGPVALRRVFELLTFSYLIGNGDLHGKNFSARMAPSGTWEVSPAYDLVSTQPYLGWRDPMALDLYGRANRFDRRHLVESGARLGLPERAVARVVDQIADRAEPWLDRVDRIGLGERPTELLRELIRTRLAELRPGLGR
ncbi:MAG: type II toxin-antitoxin system HipA family toxin [Mycobacteriales bacterium]